MTTTDYPQVDPLAPVRHRLADAREQLGDLRGTWALDHFRAHISAQTHAWYWAPDIFRRGRNLVLRPVPAPTADDAEDLAIDWIDCIWRGDPTMPPECALITSHQGIVSTAPRAAGIFKSNVNGCWLWELQRVGPLIVPPTETPNPQRVAINARRDNDPEALAIAAAYLLYAYPRRVMTMVEELTIRDGAQHCPPSAWYADPDKLTRVLGTRRPA